MLIDKARKTERTAEAEMDKHPKWQAHHVDGYDKSMRKRAVNFIGRIDEDQGYPRSAQGDVWYVCASDAP